MTRNENRHIVITDKAPGLPYSKGVMATSLMVSGLPAEEAFRIAERIEAVLVETDQHEISSAQLRDLAVTLLSEVGEQFAGRYLKWQLVTELDVPLILLIGGATGVGKSTATTQLAARLGISRVISTDAVREVLRSSLSPELIPTMYESSFEAGSALRGTLPRTADRLLIGFQEQVSAVAVGLKALIIRALEEGTDMIIEGAHVVPGFIDQWEEEFPEAVLVPVVMAIQDEALHRSHLHRRSLETRSKRHDHYLESFDKIRTIQGYITQAATERGVPVIDAFDLDSTLQELVSIVVEKAVRSERFNQEVPLSSIEVASREPSKGRKMSRLKSWEVLAGRRRST